MACRRATRHHTIRHWHKSKRLAVPLASPPGFLSPTPQVRKGFLRAKSACSGCVLSAGKASITPFFMRDRGFRRLGIIQCGASITGSNAGGCSLSGQAVRPLHSSCATRSEFTPCDGTGQRHKGHRKSPARLVHGFNHGSRRRHSGRNRILPPAATTRWHGTTIANGFRRQHNPRPASFFFQLDECQGVHAITSLVIPRGSV